MHFGRFLCNSRKLRSVRSARAVAAVVIALGMAGGCETKSWLDPSEVGSYKKDPLLLPILDHLDTGVEEPNKEFLYATDIRPEDLVASNSDYRIGKNDLVSVSITDLQGPGVETVKTARVSESGMISLPYIGPIPAAGRTESDLEQEIIKAYKDANLMQNPQVSVTVAEARARTFSILGAVGAPGQYQILQSDFRMLDALVVARDVGPDTDYAFIIRPIETEGPTSQPAGGAGQSGPTTKPSTEGSPDILAPRSDARPTKGLKQQSSAQARGTNRGEHVVLLQTHATTQSGATTSPAAASSDALAPESTAAPTPAPAPAAETNASGGKYVTIDGKQVLITEPTTADTVSPSTGMPGMTSMGGGEGGATTKGFEFNALQPPTDKRVIRIPLQELKLGDLRYNVVIKPNDMIVVPAPIVGEYYMGGHVARVGVYSLTGRKITLKQAIVSAGMLDQLAIPARTDIIRRIGPDKEIFARVDLDAIFDGRQPDMFLKPNDIVQVGTNALAPFLAAIRGGFRISYGFGFIYDKNFSDQNNGF